MPDLMNFQFLYIYYIFDTRIGMVFLFPENIRHYFATLWTAATIQINKQNYTKAVDNGIVINSSSGGIYSTTVLAEYLWIHDQILNDFVQLWR